MSENVNNSGQKRLKHLYTESGGWVPDQLPFSIREQLFQKYLAGKDRKVANVEAYKVFNDACGVFQSFKVSDSMSGLGGCRTASEVLEDPDPINQALKFMLEQDVIPNYFPFFMLWEMCGITCDALLQAAGFDGEDDGP